MPARSAARLPAVSLAAAILFAAVLPAALASPSKPEQPGRLKILVPQSTSAIPFLMLADEDPLKGIDIQVETFLAHAQALALLLRGDADLLYTGTSQGWENRLGGTSIVIVGTGVWGVSSLVGKDASIARVADLKGKRIALPFPGSPLDFQTRYLLGVRGSIPTATSRSATARSPRACPGSWPGSSMRQPCPSHRPRPPCAAGASCASSATLMPGLRRAGGTA